MSSRASMEPKKRKRTTDNSSKMEPMIKRARRNKTIKVENDQATEAFSRSKLSNSGKRKNFKSDYEINNNTPIKNLIPKKNIKKEVFSSVLNGFSDINSKIINSKDFKELRDLRILLDRTVVNDYLRKQLLLKNQTSSVARKRGRPRKSSKKIDTKGSQGQKTLHHFFDANAAINQNPTIDSKALLPLVSIKGKSLEIKSCPIEQMKFERVTISIKDLLILCDVKVNLERLHSIDSISESTNDNIISSNVVQPSNYCSSDYWIKSEISEDTSIDESLAKIKLEDANQSIDENMKMEISNDSLNLNEMNFWWNEDGEPCFQPMEIENMSKIKVKDALAGLQSDDRLLAFYDECPDVPMEELEVTVDKEVVEQKVKPEVFVNFVNSANVSCNSSRYSWPVSDESGIFMSDDSSTYFSEVSSKHSVNSSFDGLGNVATTIK